MLVHGAEGGRDALLFVRSIVHAMSRGVRPVFRAQVLALASTLNSSSAQRASGEMWSVGVNFCTRASPGFGIGGWLRI